MFLGSVGTGIGYFKCKSTERDPLCNDWDTEALDSLTNFVSIHDNIARLWVLGCVGWKILLPLLGGFYGGEDKYLDINHPVYEGELVKNDM